MRPAPRTNAAGDSFAHAATANGIRKKAATMARPRHNNLPRQTRGRWSDQVRSEFEDNRGGSSPKWAARRSRVEIGGGGGERENKGDVLITCWLAWFGRGGLFLPLAKVHPFPLPPCHELVSDKPVTVGLGESWSLGSLGGEDLGRRGASPQRVSVAGWS
jgi:hypothetical protein